MTSNSQTQKRPWDDLVPPESGYRSKLVDENQRWAFYWGRKRGSGPALLLRVDHPFDVKGRDLRGIAVEALRDGTGNILTVTLNSDEDGEVFEYFCRRLILICSRCSSEADAVSQMLLEIERWHEFLGRVRSGLSLEQRLGLFGELSFLDELIENCGPVLALESWEGPTGTPQDFAFRSGFVEVKAVKEGGSRVRISSEYQLDVSPEKKLYIKVFEIEDSVDGFGLVELINQIHSKLDPTQQNLFAERIELVGLVNVRQYSSDSWRIKTDHVYLVDSLFPALRASTLDPSISSVQYRLNVSQLRSFRRPNSEIFGLMGDESHVS